MHAHGAYCFHNFNLRQNTQQQAIHFPFHFSGLSPAKSARKSDGSAVGSSSGMDPSASWTLGAGPVIQVWFWLLDLGIFSEYNFPSWQNIWLEKHKGCFTRVVEGYYVGIKYLLT